MREGSLPIRGAAVDSRRVRPAWPSSPSPVSRPTATGSWTRRPPRGRRAGGPGAARCRLARSSPRGGVSVIAVADPGGRPAGAGRAWRDRFSPLVVGITGSLAKTSTKEQVAEVLAERWTVLRNEGNENNEIGLPLTLLRLAARARGGRCSRWACTCRATSPSGARSPARHRGGHGGARRPPLARRLASRPSRRASASSSRRCPAGGAAVLNADDPRVTRMAAPTSARGDDATASTRPRTCAPRRRVAGRRRDALHAPAARRPLARPSTPALGRHSVHNALAAAAVGLSWAWTPPTIARGSARGFRAPHRTTLCGAAPGGSWTTATTRRPTRWPRRWTCWPTLPGRHVAVLGEMMELGDGAQAGPSPSGHGRAARGDALVVVGAGAARHRGRRRARRAWRRQRIVTRSPTGGGRGALLARVAAGDAVLRQGLARRARWIVLVDLLVRRLGRPGALAHERLTAIVQGILLAFAARGHPHARLHPAAAPPGHGQAHPHRGTAVALRQGGHAHDGRPPHHRRGAGIAVLVLSSPGRLRRRLDLRAPGHARPRGPPGHRGRLAQRPHRRRHPRPPEAAVADRRAPASPRWQIQNTYAITRSWCPSSAPSRHPRLALHPVRGLRHRGHQQRRQLHRRPRRPGRRHAHLRVRGLHGHRGASRAARASRTWPTCCAR